MTAVTYTAKRSLIGGHSASTEYALDLPAVAINPARSPSVEMSQSMSGERETLRYHAVEFYDVTLAKLSGSALDAVREFLDSVESGEPFDFDPYGSANTPHNPMVAELEQGGYELPRTEAKGQGGANDGHTVSFRVRVLKS